MFDASTLIWLVSCMLLPVINSLDNGLARTPPMGWMDWERFRCNIDCKNDPDNCIGEKLLMDTADRMAADGYRDAGYRYVSIDDCWMAKQRDANGKLQADPERFPRGMKFLADYMHNKSLLLGIYEDFGTRTCGGYPGSEFFLSDDAQTFADWGVDMLKLDGCNADKTDMSVGYPTMGFFLNKTGRPILYSCSWPAYTGSGAKTDYKLIAKSCNMWRNYADVEDSWASIYGIIQYYGKNPDNFAAVAGPGNWNDPDQLIIGDFGLSWEQQRVQMGMWAIMASPLFMSVDLRTIKPESRDLLLNKRVIAINQDPLGVQGSRLYQLGKVEVWTKPLQKKSYALAVLNGDNKGTPTKMTLTFGETRFDFNGVYAYNVTEAFDGKPLGIFSAKEKLQVTINPTGIFLAVAVPVPKKDLEHLWNK
ncbi:alpha-N-acetylgalactosaminidase-like [Haliotis rufescens]|uniref:alpha-N-acetylgalactosaminidase-like n=1 Tax=Haliotis rufescens TaxID=6454 RepID=UPI001EB09C40|nr:alpha-N-acetylgalactosaminidase-like [Haliotis rufescens]